MGTSWRKPRGIDNRVRRRFRGAKTMPSIGFGSSKKTRHMLPNGFRKVTVANVNDLDMLMMHNRDYAVELAKCVSAKNVPAILARAKQLDLLVLNPNRRQIVRATE